MIFSSGMVSASHYSSNKGKSLKTAFRSGLPMLVLGLVRVVVIKLLGYQEHVSEYGMYWNFFITIALLPILSSLVSKLFDVKHFAVVALAISCLYEIALKKTRLEQYLLGDYRIDLISMNKEGIFSLIGCTCLFLASCWVGENARHVRDTKSYRQFVKKMALSSIISTSAYLLGHHLFDLESSRRLVKSHYRNSFGFIYFLGKSWLQSVGLWFLHPSHCLLFDWRSAASSPIPIQHTLRGCQPEPTGHVLAGQSSDWTCQYDLADFVTRREGDLSDPRLLLCRFVLCRISAT